MNVFRLAGGAGLLSLLLVPAAWGSDGVLRGSVPGAAPQSVDLPGVQVMRLPSGSLLKRLPGQQMAGEPAAASTVGVVALARGVSVQQLGAAQLQVLGNPPMAPVTAPPADMSVRQIGPARLRELAGARSAALAVVTATAVRPVGARVVDLPAGAPVPAWPAPDTLYRRLPD